jgi:hypothetical protein
MRVTDPNATKVIKHPSDEGAEFEISVSLSRDKRMAFAQELQSLAPKADEPMSQTRMQGFYGRLVKECLKGLRGVEDASGGILALMGPVSDALLKQLQEIRLPDFDNLVLWLGQEIYKENILSEEDKKKLQSRLSTDSTKSTDEA